MRLDRLIRACSAHHRLGGSWQKGTGYLRSSTCAAACSAFSLLVLDSTSRGAVVEAKSAARDDVEAAISSASESDTVHVPAGTAVWSAPLLIYKNILLQGSGASATVIVDEVPRMTGGNGRAPRTPQAPRQHPAAARGQPTGGGEKRGLQNVLIKIELTKNVPFRMTGFTFRGGSTQTQKTSNGVIAATGDCHLFRIDHCTFDQLHGTNINLTGFLWGVIDHCTFKTTANHAVHIGHATWNGGDFGNGSWADAPSWGSEKFIFIEDNVFENSFARANGTATSGGIDSFEGARFVVRYNKFHNCILSMHGTEGQGRSAKQAECYNNSYVNDNPSSAGQVRGGSILTHDNTWTNVGRGNVLQCYRLFNYSPHWGWANGANPYDDNALNPAVVKSSNGQFEGTRGCWATGKHTGESGAAVLTDSAAHWPSDQWVAKSAQEAACFILRNITQEKSVANEKEKRQAFIKSNTADSITCSGLTFEGRPRITFNSGDVYEIWKIDHALDQPGMGQGELLRGLSAQPARWPREVSEPCYSWNNTQAGQPVDLSAAEPQICEGRDYFNGKAKPGYVPYVYPHPLTKR